MPLGEPHKKIEHKLTADENGLRPLTAALPGSRLDMSAHPTDFKWDERLHPRDAGGRFSEGGRSAGNKPGKKPQASANQAEDFKPGDYVTIQRSVTMSGQRGVVVGMNQHGQVMVRIGARPAVPVHPAHLVREEQIMPTKPVTGTPAFEDQPGAGKVALTRDELVARKEITREELTAHMMSKLVGAKKFSDVTKGVIEKVVHDASKNFTGAAMKKIARNVKKFKIVPIQTFKEILGKRTNTVPVAVQGVAFYGQGEGGKQIVFSDNHLTASNMAHEMAHAWDATNIGSGTTSGWPDIYEDEIVKKKKLRDYARKNKSEGFAVAVETAIDRGPAYLKQEVPRAYAYLIKKKVIRKDV